MAVTSFDLEINTVPNQMGVSISSTECKTKSQYKINTVLSKCDESRILWNDSNKSNLHLYSRRKQLPLIRIMLVAIQIANF
jgi:hypothetical protein